MGHDEHRCSRGTYRLQHGRLGVGVKTCRRLVKDQQTGLGLLHPHQSAGQGHTTTFPGGQTFGVVVDTLIQRDCRGSSAIQGVAQHGLGRIRAP